MPKSWRTSRHPESVARALPTVTVTTTAAQSAPAADVAPRVELLVQEARREAFEVGRTAGHEEALSSIEAARSQRIELLASQIAEAAEHAASMRAEIVEEIGREMAEFVVDLTEVLLAKEVQGHEALCERILRAMALAPDGPDLVIRVNPQSGLSDDEIRSISNRVVDIVRDPAVDVTGCVVTVGGCKVDAQISTALDRVRRELEGAYR